jgi:mannosyl-oligosaccharide glucosidase
VTEDYSSIAKLLSDFTLLNQMHYDKDHGAYLDFGNHTEEVRKFERIVSQRRLYIHCHDSDNLLLNHISYGLILQVRLVWKEVIHEDGHLSRELVRETYGKPELRLVPHIGYVSFFPFMFRIIPADSSILDKQLDLISNGNIVWSDYGLLSLAKTSSLYMKYNSEHQAPYWRGAIWMNMNYMILSSLHHYSTVDGPYNSKARTIYEELRSNLIRNVVRNYDQTGIIWEHYDQTKGTGEGARVFTGWSALILLIMSEEYPLF